MREWYSNSWNHVVEKLGSDIYKGLNSDSIVERRKLYGENYIPVIEAKGVSALGWQYAGHLWFALILINAIWLVYSKAYIYLAVLLILCILDFTFYVKSAILDEKGADGLRELNNLSATVLRNSRTVNINCTELVVGDIVLLEKGALVAADLRLTESDNLKVRETVVTGEERSVEKYESKIDYEIASLSEVTNVLYKGSIVMEGSAVGIVIAVGAGSQLGLIVDGLVSGKTSEKNLLEKLNSIKNTIAFSAVIASFVLAVISFYNGAEWSEVFNRWGLLLLGGYPHGIIILYLAFLLIARRRLGNSEINLQRLISIDMVARTSLIMIDKVGAVTENVMIAKEIFTNGNIMEAYTEELLKDYNIRRIIYAGVLCNNSTYDDESGESKGELPDIGMLKLGCEKGINKGDLEREEKRIFEIPFDIQKNIMTTVNKVEGNYRAYVKGGSDAVLRRCTHIMRDGIEKDINDEDVEDIRTAEKNMTSRGLRVVAFAYRNFGYEPSKHENIESNLVFVGLVGLENPVMKEAAAILDKCRRHGIRPVIMSSEGRIAAYSSLRNLRIAASANNVLTDEEYNRLGEEQLKRNISSYSILSKLSPRNKIGVLKILKEKGYCTAAAGNKLVEIQLLNTADVSVAKGERCSKLMKELCDIHIVRNYLSNMVEIVAGSRIVIDNIKKSIWYMEGYLMSYIAFNIFIAIGGYESILMTSGIGLVHIVLFPLSTVLILSGNYSDDTGYYSAEIGPRLLIAPKGRNALVHGVLSAGIGFFTTLILKMLKISSSVYGGFLIVMLYQLTYVNKFRCAKSRKMKSQVLLYLADIFIHIILTVLYLTYLLG